MFDIIYGQKEDVPKKPDPTALNQQLLQLSLAKSEAIFVGDSNVDIQTGNNAEVQSIGVLWGFRDEPELTQSGASHLASHPNDILSIVLS